MSRDPRKGSREGDSILVYCDGCPSLTGECDSDFFVHGVQDLNLNRVNNRGDDSAPCLAPIPGRAVNQVPPVKSNANRVATLRRCVISCLYGYAGYRVYSTYGDEHGKGVRRTAQPDDGSELCGRSEFLTQGTGGVVTQRMAKMRRERRSRFFQLPVKTPSTNMTVYGDRQNTGHFLTEVPRDSAQSKTSDLISGTVT